MTYYEALELFSESGNVCADIARLAEIKPTYPQLDLASQIAIRNGQDKEIVDEARTAIIDYYGELDGQTFWSVA